MMKKSKKWTPQKGANLNYILLNMFNGTDLMFLFQDGLSLIFNRLSFNFFLNY